MKKLKFKLEGKEMLSKDQMKKISGGYSTCSIGVADCNSGHYPCCQFLTYGGTYCHCVADFTTPYSGQCDSGGQNTFWCTVYTS